MNNAFLDIIVHEGEVVLEQTNVGYSKKGIHNISTKYYLTVDEARELIDMLDQAIGIIEEGDS